MEYHGLLQEYHYRTRRDCGIPWITSEIPLQDSERLWNTMDYFRNTTAGRRETVGYHGLPLQVSERLWNTMDYFRNTTAGRRETVGYHGLLQEYSCRTWRDCGVPWTISGIPLQALERLRNTMDYFRNTTAGF